MLRVFWCHMHTHGTVALIMTNCQIEQPPRATKRDAYEFVVHAITWVQPSGLTMR